MHTFVFAILASKQLSARALVGWSSGCSQEAGTDQGLSDHARHTPGKGDEYVSFWNKSARSSVACRVGFPAPRKTKGLAIHRTERHEQRDPRLKMGEWERHACTTRNVNLTCSPWQTSVKFLVFGFWRAHLLCAARARQTCQTKGRQFSQRVTEYTTENEKKKGLALCK